MQQHALGHRAARGGHRTLAGVGQPVAHRQPAGQETGALLAPHDLQRRLDAGEGRGEETGIVLLSEQFAEPARQRTPGITQPAEMK
ncbi:hypothetical protein ACFQ2M_03875 [Kitasatospora saccharophila]|uniref:hypothetical protein n=1 Tax=Kitasatospora saccharophila TaxID=407973 RepID=UPI0036377871